MIEAPLGSASLLLDEDGKVTTPKPAKNSKDNNDDENNASKRIG